MLWSRWGKQRSSRVLRLEGNSRLIWCVVCWRAATASRYFRPVATQLAYERLRTHPHLNLVVDVLEGPLVMQKPKADYGNCGPYHRRHGQAGGSRYPCAQSDHDESEGQ